MTEKRKNEPVIFHDSHLSARMQLVDLMNTLNCRVDSMKGRLTVRRLENFNKGLDGR